MSTNNRIGIRAARALLSLVEENSAEEFEAAEAILGSEKQLTTILQLLREYKQHEDAEPLTVKQLREIVRREVLSFGLANKDMLSITDALLGTNGMRMPAQLSPESLLDQALRRIEGLSESPTELGSYLITLLMSSAQHAGPDHENAARALLRGLASQALAENRIYFPTLHALAQLRTRWGSGPLPYKHQEPRHNLTKRLLKDVEQVPDERERFTLIRRLLLDGLRGPADAEIAEVRRINMSNKKKAHGE